MAEDRDTAAGIDASRHLNRARAALREAAEHLEDAAAAGRHASLGVASALSHVGAARRAILPHALDRGGQASEADAA